MKFEYLLKNNAGWAEIIFEHSNIILNYDISFLGGDLTDLLVGILLLTGHQKHLKILTDAFDNFRDNSEQFIWSIDEEGYDIKFIFKILKNNKEIALKIIEYDGNSNKKCVFKNIVNFDELIDSLLKSCSDILNKYGIIGYYQNFWVKFPLEYYLILKDYKERKLVFDFFYERNNEKIQNMERTNLKDEIKYLQ